MKGNMALRGIETKFKMKAIKNTTKEGSNILENIFTELGNVIRSKWRK